MSTPILATKLYIPAQRPKVVSRPRLIERLNAGLGRKLTLISAPAGFGKTTLVSEWLIGGERPVAWLSLDEEDNDPLRFLTYLIAALQTITPTLGTGVLRVLQSPQPPSTEAILTILLNEIATIPNDFVLVLDDYHGIDTKATHQFLAFLLAHLPPQMHLVIVTREDPPLPLARLRVRNQLTELRVAELRFTHSEAAEFFGEVMNLSLSTENIAALEARTEGWIAGLQLAAISMQGLEDTTAFIHSFTGSHHFVLDYLVEEVLHQQSENVQSFLLRTSILSRLCAPLCDAVLPDADTSAQEILEFIERANLFIVPLDNERRWYRYHHLFADLLRQRLYQSVATSTKDGKSEIDELHQRAGLWLERNGLELEAFHHAVAAHDIQHAERLIEGAGMPLYFRGGAMAVLNWLESLPTQVLDASPALWVTYASVLLFASRIAEVEPKLQAAENALHHAEPNDKNRDLLGHIASIRATVAVSQHDEETIIAQSRRALEYLHPDNLPVRTATTWTMGYAYSLRGARDQAYQAYTEAQSISQAIGHTIITIMATIGLGNLQERDTHLHGAAETYRRILLWVGEPPLPIACEPRLGLARLCYEWNDLDAAYQHTQQSIQLARQLETTDRVVAAEIFLARLKIAQGDETTAATILAGVEQSVRQRGFVYRVPEVVATQVLLLLRHNHMATAEELLQNHDLPLSRARVYLAQGNTTAALEVLGSLRHQPEEQGWADERLKVMILQAVAYHLQGNTKQALHSLGNALTLAEPSGFIRIFVDEGIPMAELVSEANRRGILPDYTHKLLCAWEAEPQMGEAASYRLPVPSAPPLIEPLSQRELEVLGLIAQGFSNHEISGRLFLALNTVKGHNQRIFGKLQVLRRTEAVARARELGLL
jgi:LuxR family maltose regulon positive regulatory protein